MGGRHVRDLRRSSVPSSADGRSRPRRAAGCRAGDGLRGRRRHRFDHHDDAAAPRRPMSRRRRRSASRSACRAVAAGPPTRRRSVSSAHGSRRCGRATCSGRRATSRSRAGSRTARRCSRCAHAPRRSSSTRRCRAARRPRPRGPPGGFTVLRFRLTERVGGDCMGAAGHAARGAIRVRANKIVEWYRLPDDPDDEQREAPEPPGEVF